MKNYLVLFLTLTLIACGPSQDEKEKIAAVSCSIMGATRNMDAADRIREMNATREKIGGEPFLRGDYAIKEAFKYGLCEELMLDASYDESLGVLKDAERERERIATEEKRIRDNKLTVKESFYPNGELKRRTNYRGFNRHGFLRMWHENGQLESETTFEDGRREGLARDWHKNGQLKSETTWKNGVKNGFYRSWNADGSFPVEKCYKNGEEVGSYRCKV
ncbi:hypothetical protein N9P68_01005 [Pseudomonadales bacterium]|nr:hypothetical protein [Pseudomonadales bacterium]